MDLNSMLQREDFFNIFFLTIEQYCKEVYRVDVNLSFAGGRSSANLIIYPKLSAAVTRNISKKARGFFYSEWNIRGSRLKNRLTKMYVSLMTHSHGLFARYKLSLRPEALLSCDIVIAPNNRSIRVFDYASDTVGCMIKQGFTGKYFINQLQFRLKHNYSFVLPPLRWGTDWFVEPILHGHPLARITDQGLYNEGVRQAIGDLGALARDTRRYMSCKDYVDSLRIALLSGLAAAKSRKKIRTSDVIDGIVRKLSAPFAHSGLLVPVVTSHGDLQSGNIWVEDSGKVWVYDWETVGERSVWYDACTLLLCTRRAGGIEKLWNERKGADNRGAILANDDKKNYTSDEIELIIRLVLLEDIQFYLEDMLELPEDWGSDIFDKYMSRLNALLTEEKRYG